MKTALQELIERFEGYIEKYDRDPLIKKLVNSIKYECEKDLFAKEKEQIIIAYQTDMDMCSDEDAKQYYNETFNN